MLLNSLKIIISHVLKMTFHNFLFCKFYSSMERKGKKNAEKNENENWKEIRLLGHVDRAQGKVGPGSEESFRWI